MARGTLTVADPWIVESRWRAAKNNLKFYLHLPEQKIL